MLNFILFVLSVLLPGVGHILTFRLLGFIYLISAASMLLVFPPGYLIFGFFCGLQLVAARSAKHADSLAN